MGTTGSIFDELGPSEELIGSSVTQSVEWRRKQVLLYAVGVGAGLGDPLSELAFTAENVEGVELKALPTFLTLLTGPVRPEPFQRLDRRRFVQAQQRIELVRPIPPSGRGIAEATVDSVLDKGSGALVGISTKLYENADPTGVSTKGRLIGGATMTVFIKGGGGFGGQRGPEEPFALPSRQPDVTIRHETRPEQALLYRLSGDRHPLHVDPSFARRMGFTGPVLHGLCTYGFCGRALIAALAEGDPGRLAMMECRFARPVYPGDSLATRMWVEGESILYHVTNGEGEIVLDRGRATIRPRHRAGGANTD